MKKRPKNRRAEAKKRIRIFLVESLKQLGEGLTPPERVQAHVDFYSNHCNLFQQEILREIFTENEDETLTEISEFFAEKNNVR